MPKIQYGSVVFERKLNTGDYSHKLANVDLSFEVSEGEDVEAAALEVAKIAVRVALVTTGETNPLVTETELTATAAKRTKGGKKDVPAPLAEAGAAPPTVDAMGAVPASSNSGGSATGPVLNAVGKPADPMGAVPVATAPAQAQPENAAMGGTPATAQTTDAAAAGTPALADTDLTSAVMKAMQTLAPVYGNEVAAAKCGDLIQQFGGPGGVSAIPVDKRPEFMAGLKTLA